ncbi:hypothetical protein FRC03_003774 [Tulasnella sp. 419]|nr:hypothetical protein FRC02_005412 [Tulasnella sp. 418]KAG8969249.1 hypothetical protein FRC03_003774 [Tulasnella sp. 419]
MSTQKAPSLGESSTPSTYSFVNVSTTDGSWPEQWGKTPKTRKRITKQQLQLLEELYQRVSHPSREARQAIALQTGMELRSVTIWLQNKRQIVRKNALAAQAARSSSNNTPISANTPDSRDTSATSSAASSPAPEDPVEPEQEDATSRPSLDRVASLSEFPSPARQVHQKDSPEIWNHMPSSPPSSPPPESTRPTIHRYRSSPYVLHKTISRPYPQQLSRTLSVDSAATATSTASAKDRDRERSRYLKPNYTLEWACAHAAQRHSSHDGEASDVPPEELRDESVTPVSDGTASTKVEEDGKSVSATNEEMQAALALCGLLNG